MTPFKRLAGVNAPALVLAQNLQGVRHFAAVLIGMIFLSARLIGEMADLYNGRRSREGSRMRSCLVHSCEPVPWLRVSLVLILTFALSGWTCTAVSCFATTPQIVSLSPSSMSANATPVPLVVIGDNFIPESQIMWNGHALATTFVDSQHLQTSITQQTFQQFGGSQGNNVRIAVNSPAARCPVSGSSATLVLVIN